MPGIFRGAATVMRSFWSAASARAACSSFFRGPGNRKRLRPKNAAIRFPNVGRWVLGEGDIEDCGQKKQHRKDDRCVEQAFFHAAFGAKNRAFATERRSKTGAALLKKDRGDHEDGKRDLDDGKDGMAHTFCPKTVLKMGGFVNPRYNISMHWHWRMFKNPWVVFGTLVSIAVMFGLGVFTMQVVGYVGNIRAGEPNPFDAKEAERKAALVFGQKPISDEARARIEVEEGNPLLGNPDAPIRLVEFVDYECPFCKRSAPEVRAFLARHPDEILLIIRDFPIGEVHENAMPAAIAARCVFSYEGANAYWRFHDILYRDQDRLSSDMIRATAEFVGADMARFDRCVSRREPEAAIRESYDLGVSLGVRGTPTFFWNGVPIPGAVDLATLEAMLLKWKTL